MTKSSKTKINPNLIPLIRKMAPNTIANSIVGVQPMSTSTASIFSLWHDHIVHDWEKVFIFFPRKTLRGKWCIGRINRRLAMIPKGTSSIEYPLGGADMTIKTYKEGYEYATDKEIFLIKLEGKEAVPQARG